MPTTEEILGPRPDQEPAQQPVAGGAPSTIPATKPSPQAMTLAPMTAQAAREPIGMIGPGGEVQLYTSRIVQERMRKFVPTEADKGESGYVSRNVQGGRPIDIYDEVSPLIAFMAESAKNQEDKVRYLASQFGPENVRVDDRGEPLITVTDEKTGKKKDIPLNAHGMSVNDLMTLAAAIPKMVGASVGVGASRAIPGLGKMKGAKGFLRDVAGGAVGMETAGAAQEVATKAQAKQPIEFSDILKERAGQVPIDMAADYALAGLAKPLLWVKRALQGETGIASPLAAMRGPIQNDAIEAKKFIADKTGIDIPIPVGESSGIPFLAKLYEYIYRHPAGASPILKEREARDASKKALQEFMLEPATLKDDETVGKAVINALDELKNRTTREVETRAGALTSKLTGDIKGQAGVVSKSGPQPDFSEVGTQIRDKIIAGRDAAKAEQTALREKIASIPGATGKVFDSQQIGLQQAAKKQLANLPSPEQTLTTTSPIVGPTGAPISVTKTAKVLEKDFIPPEIVGRLKSLSEDKKFSLDDLIQMRSDTYSAIASGEAIPHAQTHYLSEIGKMLTGAIENGIDSLPSGDLKTALREANKHYKEKVLPFESSGIADLFSRVTEPGFKESTDVVTRLMRDPDKYKRTVDFIGKGSPEHEALKRTIFDQVLAESADDMEGKVINPDALLKNLKNLSTDQKTKAMFADVFGAAGQNMATSAKLMRDVELIKSGKMDKADLENIMRSSDPSMVPVKRLIDSWREQERVYNNQVIRKLVSGELDPSKVKAEDFVSKFLDSADYSDVAQAWGHLASEPDLQDQVKRKLVERIFIRASRSPEPSDVAAKLRGDPTHIVSSSGLMNAIGDKANQDKLNLIIGKDRLDLLKGMTSLQAAEDWAKQEAGATGMFASGNAVGGIMRMKPSGVTGELGELIKYKLAAVLLTSTPFRKALSSTYTPKEIPWLAKAVVTSEPFISAVYDDLKQSDKVLEFLRAAKAFAGLSVSPDETGKKPSAQAPGTKAEDLLGPRPSP